MIIFAIIMFIILRTGNCDGNKTKSRFKNISGNISDIDMKKFVNFVECNIPYGKKGCEKNLTKYYTLDIDGDSVVLVPPPEEEN